MLKNRRSLIFSSIALPFALAGTSASAESSSIPPTSDEQEVVDYMADHGINNFVMLNKSRGQLVFFENKKITQLAKALSGRLSGDAPRDNLGVTPAGIFILRPYGDGKHIGFKETGENIDYSIHTLTNPRGQKRPERLASNSAEFKRISSGCINTSQDTMDRLHGFINKHQEVFRKEDGDPLVMGTFFVVLPERKSVLSILKYPEFTVR